MSKDSNKGSGNSEVSALKRRITELEEELRIKSAEVLRYRTEFQKVNSTLEKLISDASHELRLAQKLQKALVPTELSLLQGFEVSNKFVPGTHQGGDFFDYFELADKMRFVVFLSSCSGYTLSSMLLSALIRFSGLAEARRGLSPEKAVAAILSEIQGSLTAKDEINLFYALFDRRSFQMSYCGIGLTYATLQQHGKSALKNLNAGAKEVHRGSNLEELKVNTIELQPLDRIILASAGVVLSQNEANQFFGSSGIDESIFNSPQRGVHDVRNEILFSAEKFSGRSEPQRDQTVLVLEVKEQILRLTKS